MNAQQVPLRERKKKKTRELLHETALRLFAQQGFEATTVEQLTLEAGVSRRTFFRYFPSKEAVAFAEHAGRVKRFRELLEEEEGPALQQVKEAFLHLADEYMSHRERLALQQEVINNSKALIMYELQLDKEWEEVIADALIKGPLNEFERKVQAGMLIGAIRAVLRHWFAHDTDISLRSLGEQVFHLMEAGVSWEP